jgi:hypothetical protein
MIHILNPQESLSMGGPYSGDLYIDTSHIDSNVIVDYFYNANINTVFYVKIIAAKHKNENENVRLYSYSIENMTISYYIKSFKYLKIIWSDGVTAKIRKSFSDHAPIQEVRILPDEWVVLP